MWSLPSFRQVDNILPLIGNWLFTFKRPPKMPPRTKSHMTKCHQVDFSLDKFAVKCVQYQVVGLVQVIMSLNPLRRE